MITLEVMAGADRNGEWSFIDKSVNFRVTGTGKNDLTPGLPGFKYKGRCDTAAIRGLKG